jgi:hypothetical protein
MSCGVNGSLLTHENPSIKKPEDGSAFYGRKLKSIIEFRQYLSFNA